MFGALDATVPASLFLEASFCRKRQGTQRHLAFFLAWARVNLPSAGFH